MPEEAASTTVESIKTSSDGSVKIAIEKYNELLETIANQKAANNRLNEQLIRVRSEPPVIHRTVVEKTPEMLAQERRVWGGTFMGLGASSFIIGALLYKAGKS